MKDYGKELILDLHECDTTQFNRKCLKKFFKELCNLIGMQREDLHFWDYIGEETEYHKAAAHLRGTSAIQFISTSNITVHTLDELKRVYLNVFSCKDFSSKDTINFCMNYFDGKIISKHIIDRI